MQMPRQTPASYADDHGWLITPRALTSVATVVGLIYTLHAPVRYVLQIGAHVDALSARVTNLETEIDHQRGTIAAAELMLLDRNRGDSVARISRTERVHGDRPDADSTRVGGPADREHPFF